MGAFTNYVSSPRGGGGLVSSLLLPTEGGEGVHGQDYVSIADLEITIDEEFPRLSFGQNECVQE